MSKKQRSQQAHPTLTAPADAQISGSGQGSSRAEKAASEDDLSAGGESDESGAIFVLFVLHSALNFCPCQAQ